MLTLPQIHDFNKDLKESWYQINHKRYSEREENMDKDNIIYPHFFNTRRWLTIRIDFKKKRTNKKAKMHLVSKFNDGAWWWAFNFVPLDEIAQLLKSEVVWPVVHASGDELHSNHWFIVPVWGHEDSHPRMYPASSIPQIFALTQIIIYSQIRE